MPAFCLSLMSAALRLRDFGFETAIELTRLESVPIAGGSSDFKTQIDPDFSRLRRRCLIGDRHGQA